MNHYAARQISSSGKWHYTCRNGENVWAVGYCSTHELCPRCGDKPWTWRIEDGDACVFCAGTGSVKRSDPCPGHDTRDEAEQHYEAYLLDHSYFRPRQEEWPKNKCHVVCCNKEGTVEAVVDAYHLYVFCPEHANKETLSQFVRVGESWSS